MLVFFLCVLNLTLIAAIVAIYWKDSEAISFNGGYCPNCGHKYRFFMDDWLLGRGYICDSCSNTAWVHFDSTDRSSE
jgi:hypothetical protein